MTPADQLTDLEASDKITTALNIDGNKFTSRHNALNGLSIWQNFDTSKQAQIKNQHRTESMTIFVITKGTGALTINREKVQVQQNSLVQIAPNTLLDLPAEKQIFTLTGVSFTNDFLMDIGISKRLTEVFNYYSSRHVPVWDLEAEDTELIKHQVRQLAQRVNKYATHQFGREILVHEFNIFLFEIGALVQKYSQMTRLTFSRRERLVIRFSNLAQQQFRELRTVKKYADQLNVTAKYLTEVVKECSGKNAGEIINDLVILEAKFLLRKSELNISEIAETLHFSDQSFFGRYFKRQTGMSPKMFRKMEYSIL